MPSAMVKPLNVISTAKPISACRTRNKAAWATLTWPDGIGRERVRSTAAVEIAVDDVVPGAAGAAHGEGADEEQHEMRKARRPRVRRDRGERRRPPARHQQQPRADRPVEARQPQIGPQPGRRQRIDPIAGRVGDGAGRAFIWPADYRSACRTCRGRSWYWCRCRAAACRWRRSMSAPSASAPSAQTVSRNFIVLACMALAWRDGLLRHAAPRLVVFEEFHHLVLGGGEGLHRRAHLLAVAFASCRSPRPLGLLWPRRAVSGSSRISPTAAAAHPSAGLPSAAPTALTCGADGRPTAAARRERGLPRRAGNGESSSPARWADMLRRRRERRRLLRGRRERRLRQRGMRKHRAGR